MIACACCLVRFFGPKSLWSFMLASDQNCAVPNENVGTNWPASFGRRAGSPAHYFLEERMGLPGEEKISVAPEPNSVPRLLAWQPVRVHQWARREANTTPLRTESFLRRL